MIFRALCVIGLLLVGCAAPPSGASPQLPVPTSVTDEIVLAATPTSVPGRPDSSPPTVASTGVPATSTPTGAPTRVSPIVPAVLTAVPSATVPFPTSTALNLAPTELKYRLIDQYGIFYCVPSSNPATSDDETDRAVTHFAEIQKDSEVYQYILAHNRLTGVTDFSAAQKLLVYRDYQKLGLVKLEPAGGLYTFSLRTTEGLAGVVLSGTISAQGTSMATNKQPSVNRCNG